MIDQSYTLFTRISLFEGADGFYADDLWEKDLSAHLKYLKNFKICCPVQPMAEAEGIMRRVDGLAAAQVVHLRLDRGWGSVAANILPNFLRVAGAVQRSDVVHTGCAGWAFPLAYYVWLLRPFMRFQWVDVVESSFWIKPASGRVSVRQWIGHHWHEFMVRRCVRAADAGIFTQDGYRAAYLGSHERALVAPAVWIDDENFRSDDDLATAQAAAKETRLILPSRLLPDKGIETVLDAVAIWDRDYGGQPGPSFELDIIGEGVLAEQCRAFVAAFDPASRLRMRFLDPVPYAESFFELLRGYQGAIVANRQAEQARIVYDVMSQGVPCLASATAGNLAVIDDGATGAIFPVDDAATLAALFERAVREPAWLDAMGRKALAAARGYSHAAMHRQREAFLKEALDLA